MKPNHFYRELTQADLIKTSQKRHNFINCKGHFFGMMNTNQAIIITDKLTGYKIELVAPKRKAILQAKYKKKDKCYLLLNCQNQAILKSMKAYCKRHEIKAPKKVKLLLGIDDILLDKQKR